MYFLQTRWYDPTVCRFISPDSYEYLDPTTFGGLNLYAYCLNNPIMYSDPSGRSIIATFVILGIFTLVGGVVGGVKAYNNAIENSFSKKDLFCQTVLGTLVGASFGLAAGGVVVMLGAVGAGILSKTFLGAEAIKAFTVGALAYNFTAIVVAPIIGVNMDVIEFNVTEQELPNPKDNWWFRRKNKK